MTTNFQSLTFKLFNKSDKNVSFNPVYGGNWKKTIILVLGDQDRLPSDGVVCIYLILNNTQQKAPIAKTISLKKNQSILDNFYSIFNNREDSISEMRIESDIPDFPVFLFSKV
jgi:hypothetical protein